MTLVFPWGTVTSTPKGAKLTLPCGIKFELGNIQTYAAADYADGTMTIGCVFCVPATKGILHLSWVPTLTSAPRVPTLTSAPTTKSILHVGEASGPTLGARSAWSGWRSFDPVTPGTTPTLLNYGEAMEFAQALRKVAPPLKPVPTRP